MVCLLYYFYFLLFFSSPWILGDPENFITANPLVTPVHIQPKWYFLIAYAILRSIPKKFGGLVALALSILILMICPLLPKSKFRGLTFYPLNEFYYWTHINTVCLLTWIGARPVEDPYILVGQILSCIYFSYYFFRVAVQKILDLLQKYLWSFIILICGIKEVVAP